MSESESHHRRIRSFVRREGRLTPSQQYALEAYWGDYGIADEGPLLDLDMVFGRAAPRVLEIGFGDGEALLAMAQARPESDFLGIEVHRPGVGHLLRRLAEERITNVRVACADAVPFLRQRLPLASLDRINVFFPDPWPKKRHHKRRLIQSEFTALLAERLKPGGLLHLSTDWPPYAEQMLDVLTDTAGLSNQSVDYAASPAAGRPQTKFELRGRRLGHEVRDLLFRREPGESR